MSCVIKEPEKVRESVASAVPSLPLTRDALISVQRGDPSLTKCFAAADKETNKSGEKQSFLVDV